MSNSKSNLKQKVEQQLIQQQNHIQALEQRQSHMAFRLERIIYTIQAALATVSEYVSPPPPLKYHILIGKPTPPPLLQHKWGHQGSPWGKKRCHAFGIGRIKASEGYYGWLIIREWGNRTRSSILRPTECHQCKLSCVRALDSMQQIKTCAHLGRILLWTCFYGCWPCVASFSSSFAKPAR